MMVYRNTFDELARADDTASTGGKCAALACCREERAGILPLCPRIARREKESRSSKHDTGVRELSNCPPVGNYGSRDAARYRE